MKYEKYEKLDISKIQPGGSSWKEFVFSIKGEPISFTLKLPSSSHYIKDGDHLIFYDDKENVLLEGFAYHIMDHKDGSTSFQIKKKE